MEMEVYLDNELSPRPPDEVINFMRPYFNLRGYGSPTVPHRLGLEAYELVQSVLDRMRAELRASEGDFTIVGSGTEANNLAILGLKKRGRVIISSIEHRSVLDTAYKLRELGCDVREVEVDEEGHIKLDSLESQISRDTLLVSIQAVNQEVGSIQDIRAIADIVHDKGSLFHVDACDALGKLDLDLRWVDMASLSGSKIYGPRGVGFLYVKEEIELTPLMKGSPGLQNLTPVSINIPALAGFLKAFDIFGKSDRWINVKKFKDRLSEFLRDLKGVIINSPEEAIDVVNFSVSHGAGRVIIEASNRGLYISQGTNEDVSYVLKAMGRDAPIAKNSLMLKLHPYISYKEIEVTINILSDILGRNP